MGSSCLQNLEIPGWPHWQVTLLEWGYGFKSPVSVITVSFWTSANDWSTGQGLIESTWRHFVLMKGGRLPLARPKHMQPNLFASAFWHWWASLNAPARTSFIHGSSYPWSSWRCYSNWGLCVPGKNGWLVILYALLVWREWIGHGKVDDWNAV